MSILAAYFIISFIFTAFVLAAGMLSSRISQREKVVEVYAERETLPQTSRAVSRSSW